MDVLVDDPVDDPVPELDAVCERVIVEVGELVDVELTVDVDDDVSDEVPLELAVLDGEGVRVDVLVDVADDEDVLELDALGDSVEVALGVSVDDALTV